MPATGTTKDWEDALGIENPAKDATITRLQEEVDAATSADDRSGYVAEASYKREQVIELAQMHLNWLAAVSVPTIFQFLFPPVLLAIWQLLTEKVQLHRDFSRIALGIPRGRGKTTLIKLFVLYCILFTKKKFILIISDTAGKAENILSDVIDMLNESNIIRLFGDWKLGLEKDTQDIKKFGFRGRNIVLAAVGAGGSLRGLNLKQERPDVMIFDDIQDAEVARSKLQSENLETWMIGTAMKARSPHGCLYIFAGNMFPTPYSILKKLKSNNRWIKFIAGGILEDGSSIWPELHPINEVIEELEHDIAAGHPEIFFAEIMNDTEAGINSKVDLSMIKAWPWHPDELPQGKFIIIDPSNNKQGSDDVAIGYFEVFDGIAGLREVLEEKLSPGNTIRQALLMAMRHNCKLVVVESNAYQYSLLYWWGEVTKSLGITGINCEPVYSGSYSKNSRIIDMLKLLTQGEEMIHEDCRSLVTNQIVNWNPLKRNNTDNILDLLSYAPRAIELYAPLMSSVGDIGYADYENAEVHSTAENSSF